MTHSKGALAQAVIVGTVVALAAVTATHKEAATRPVVTPHAAAAVMAPQPIAQMQGGSGNFDFHFTAYQPWQSTLDADCSDNGSLMVRLTQGGQDVRPWYFLLARPAGDTSNFTPLSQPFQSGGPGTFVYHVHSNCHGWAIRVLNA